MVPVTGGDPLTVDAPITLCARSDLNNDRYFDGRIANLGIWSTQLTAPQISTLYMQAHAWLAGFAVSAWRWWI